MKKLILTLAIAVMGFTAVFAQDAAKKDRRSMPKLTAEQRADKATGLMEKKLNLNADQKTKVYALELSKAKKMDALRAEDRSAMKGKMQSMKADRDKSNADLDKILTADQKTKLDAFRAEAKEKGGRMRKGMGRGNREKAPIVSNPPAQG
ncbi:DUF4890 domain-containing protein [Pedobacter mucosus]|uniref:DUF4890 domain-containing protein n=1 Tax=Pedobacter mucosus TaxID=2895286 RepID=UPI001EE4D00A|nr:DUF4890 domain-containing protein [Pedobacter mucosus]UKT65542.1 DUF4890 domain-containing protein [Pedobacter mucosus]